MAQYRLSVNVIGRSAGRSATGAAAYRSGERIIDERTGLIHDYTRKQGVLHSEILAPDNAPDWMRDRAQLWNAVEAVERRKDAQLTREIQLSLPHELTHDQRVELVRQFVQEQHISQGMIADIALHAPSPHEQADQRNIHAHVMLTMRELTAEGFGKKAREWNAPEVLEGWREAWAQHQNKSLQRYGHAARVDHRSLEDQGIMREPQKHMGPIATEIERDGRLSHRGEENRQINIKNGKLADLEHANNLIDAKIAFEQRKFEAWAEKKRGQLDIDQKQRLTSHQLGVAVRMQALDEVLRAEFGDTKENLTHEHDEVAANLAQTGWRKFIRDITFITRRDKQDLERIERDIEAIKQKEELAKNQQLEQEEQQYKNMRDEEKRMSDNLESGIKKARYRREAENWKPLKYTPKQQETPLPDRFQNVSEREKERDDTDSEDSGNGGNQGNKQASIDAIAERLAQKREARKKRGKDKSQKPDREQE